MSHDKNLGIAFGGTGDEKLFPFILLSMALNGLAVARRIGVRFSWIFSWKILPLRDFTWLPPGHDFTSLERDTRGTQEPGGGDVVLY